MTEQSEREKLIERLERITRSAEEVGWYGADVDAMNDAVAYLKLEPARLAAARNEAREECVRVADGFVETYGPYMKNNEAARYSVDTAKAIADAIRGLKND